MRRFSADGWPQCQETMGTPSSAHTFTWASLSKQVMKLTLNGDGVAAFTARTYSRSTCGGVKPTPMAPMPPALLTAMARSGVMPAKARPAHAKGWVTPKRCVKRVAIDGVVGMVVSPFTTAYLLRRATDATALPLGLCHAGCSGGRRCVAHIHSPHTCLVALTA